MCEVTGRELEPVEIMDNVVYCPDCKQLLHEDTLIEIKELDIKLLAALLRRYADREDGPTFMGWPDRWWDTFLRRCTFGHVGRTTLKSEARGRDACLSSECGHAQVWMTFPEDVDGPLEVLV